jgi:hypothetical protein
MAVGEVVDVAVGVAESAGVEVAVGVAVAVEVAVAVGVAVAGGTPKWLSGSTENAVKTPPETVTPAAAAAGLLAPHPR